MTDGTSAIGTIHFALMALLAALVVIGIVWGVRNKRRRVQGEKEFEAHAEEAGVELNRPEPEAPPPASVPVAPSRPPLADQPAAGTPPVGQGPIQPRPLADEPPQANSLADEPIAATITPDGTPVTLAADAAAEDAPSPGDAPLTRIKGLGPKVAARMAELGIDRVGQLAALDDAGIRDLDTQMGPFTGRIMRDRWVEQARLLAAGDKAAFEAAFGRLG